MSQPLKIAAILRAGAYSPNHIGNDAAIITMVADQLRRRGMEVNLYSEEQLTCGDVTERVILNMCRAPESIDALKRLEDAGALVINSGYAIANCICERKATILLGSGVNYPESIFVDTDRGVVNELTERGISRAWVKRGESHGLHKEDVSYVRTPREAQDVLQEYFMRGMRRAVINRHIDGKGVKFYGVADGSFFLWFYPMEADTALRIKGARSKQPSMAADMDPTTGALMDMCLKAADALDVDIFGGEAIKSPDGSLTIVDFNDWPSFSTCRSEAAPRIARYILNKIKAYRMAHPDL